jgi:hypothetical protein
MNVLEEITDKDKLWSHIDQLAGQIYTAERSLREAKIVLAKIEGFAQRVVPRRGAALAPFTKDGAEG